MSRRPSSLLAVVILFSAPLAGCLGGSPAGPAAQGPDADGGGMSDGSPPVENATNDTRQDGLEAAIESRLRDRFEAEWFVLSESTDPGGIVAGYNWTIPDWAVVPDDFFDDVDHVAFEVAPISPSLLAEPDRSNTSVTDWAFLVFAKQDGRARLLAGRLAPTLEHTTEPEAGGVFADRAVDPPSFRPFTIDIQDQGLRPGDELLFVTAARSSTPDDFGFAVRFFDEDPDYEQQSTNLTRFLNRARGPPVFPSAVGNATTFQLPIYRVDHLGSAITDTWRTENVTVDETYADTTAPASNVRDVTVTAEHGSDAGWGLHTATYTAAVASAGTWEVTGDVRGSTLTSRSVVLQSDLSFYPALASAIVFGEPAFQIVGDGEGTSSVDYRLQVAGAAALDSMSYAGIDLPVPLVELVGVPGNETASAATGLAGNIPPTTAGSAADRDRTASLGRARVAVMNPSLV